MAGDLIPLHSHARYRESKSSSTPAARRKSTLVWWMHTLVLSAVTGLIVSGGALVLWCTFGTT